MTNFGLERVYTVHEYWDGPRLGVADFGGIPYVYKSVFDVGQDEWDADLFMLSPISAAQLELILEDWAIFRRFELARHTGVIGHSPDDDMWGALEEDLPRHRELASAVKAAFVVDPSTAQRARGEFVVDAGGDALPPGVIRPMKVRWSLL